MPTPWGRSAKDRVVCTDCGSVVPSRSPHKACARRPYQHQDVFSADWISSRARRFCGSSRHSGPHGAAPSRTPDLCRAVSTRWQTVARGSHGTGSGKHRFQLGILVLRVRHFLQLRRVTRRSGCVPQISETEAVRGRGAFEAIRAREVSAQPCEFGSDDFVRTPSVSCQLDRTMYVALATGGRCAQC